MSRNRHSYVPFYASDWVAGTSRMTPMQELVYFRVCCYIWDKAEPCPASELPLMLGTIDGWQDIIGQLIAAGKLVGSPAESVVNSRALAVAENAYELWDKKSKGGKRGAAKTNSPDDTPASTPAKSPVSTPADSPDGTGSGVPSQNQNQNYTIPNGMDDARAVDPAKPCYEIGKPLLAKYGISANKAGGLITKWLKAHPPDVVLNTLQHAGRQERHDIVAFVTGCLRDPLAIPDFLKRDKNGKPPSPHDKLMAGFAAAARDT